MKVTREYLLTLIKEALKKLDKDGNIVRVGPPDDLPPYHDSTTGDGGYVSLTRKKRKQTILRNDPKKDSDNIEVIEPD